MKHKVKLLRDSWQSFVKLFIVAEREMGESGGCRVWERDLADETGIQWLELVAGVRPRVWTEKQELQRLNSGQS